MKTSMVQRAAATFTAFIYAGALQSNTLLQNEQALDDWGGHSGFVHEVTYYAERIANWLDARLLSYHDQWHGVIEYELMEPLGEWLVSMGEPPGDMEVLKQFEHEYIAWIARTALENDT
jgi:hypothetical protein